MNNDFKVLFLDIDGVLNSQPFLRNVVSFNDSEHIDQTNVVHLNRIIEETGAFVVLSSAWRLDSVVGFDKTVYALRQKGFIGEVIDKTPDFSCFGRRFMHERAEEILTWLNETNPLVPWVALDDNDIQLPRSKFVLTDDMVGLTKEDADRAIKILNNIP